MIGLLCDKAIIGGNFCVRSLKNLRLSRLYLVDEMSLNSGQALTHRRVSLLLTDSKIVMSQHNLTLFGGCRQLLNEVSLRVLIKALLQIDDVLILFNI